MRLLGSFKLFFFFTKRFRMHKKHQKAQKAPKSTKRHKDTQAKAQNANKRISDYFPLTCF